MFVMERVQSESLLRLRLFPTRSHNELHAFRQALCPRPLRQYAPLIDAHDPIKA